jgi:hypothetical protein
VKQRYRGIAPCVITSNCVLKQHFRTWVTVGDQPRMGDVVPAMACPQSSATRCSELTGWVRGWQMVGLRQAARQFVVAASLCNPGTPASVVVGRCGPCVGHGAPSTSTTQSRPNSTQREPFHYFDKGSVATVSRFSAVAKIGPLEFSGFIAWLIWLVLHLVYLIGFKAKITTLLSWTVIFLSTRRGQLTITDQQAFARMRLEQLAELAAEARGSAPDTRVAS